MDSLEKIVLIGVNLIFIYPVAGAITYAAGAAYSGVKSLFSTKDSQSYIERFVRNLDNLKQPPQWRRKLENYKSNL